MNTMNTIQQNLFKINHIDNDILTYKNQNSIIENFHPWLYSRFIDFGIMFTFFTHKLKIRIMVFMNNLIRRFCRTWNENYCPFEEGIIQRCAHIQRIIKIESVHSISLVLNLFSYLRNWAGYGMNSPCEAT